MIQAHPTNASPGPGGFGFLLRGSKTNPAVGKALETHGWPKVSDQGIVLKRAKLDDKPVLVIGCGFGPTVQWEAGTLLTAFSYSGKDGYPTDLSIEVVRWRLPRATSVDKKAPALKENP